MNVNLPTELLRTLITVSDLGGYTKAGAALNRSQPAISLQMRRLEELVGAKLISNEGNKLKFTEAGEKLATYARQILHLNDDILGQFRPSSLSEPIRVGLPTDYAVSYLQDAVVEFALEHPEANIEIYCDLSENLLNSLNTDQVNLIVALVGNDQKHYLVNAWEEEPMWVAGKEAKIDLSSTIPLVGHFENCQYRKRMSDVLKRQDRLWRMAYTSPDIFGIQNAVEAGFGVSALTRATLTSSMRILSEADGLSPMEKIKVGLLYKLPRVSSAGRELGSKLIERIDSATNEYFTKVIKLS